MDYNKLPNYWEKHLNEKISIINNLKKRAGKDCSSTLMITDIHWNANNKYSAKLVERILNECHIPYYFNGGDVVSGAGICQKQSIIDDIVQCEEWFSSTENKCLMVEGNHDTCYSTLKAPNYYAENLKKKEFNKFYFGYLSKYPNIKRSEDVSYYYADDKNSKTRYIVLNSHDIPTDELNENGLPIFNTFRCFGFRNQQLNWLANKALKVPSVEWSVIISCHEPPNLNEQATFIYNFNAVSEILNLFRKHKKGKIIKVNKHKEYNINIDCDYENKGGNVIMWLTGHNHDDELGNINGIRFVVTTTDSRYNPIKDKVDVTNSIEDHSFDVFIVNKRERKVFITRIGKGQDREFNYEIF